MIRIVLPGSENSENTVSTVPDEYVRPETPEASTAGTKAHDAECDLCGTPFVKKAHNHRFCSLECRKREESKTKSRARAAKRNAAAEERNEERKVPGQKKVIVPVIPITVSPDADTTPSRIPNGNCSIVPMGLPWDSNVPTDAELDSMFAVCLGCEVRNMCAMMAFSTDASGVWAGTLMHKGFSLAWVCQECGGTNGEYEVCTNCSRTSLIYRAKATDATRKGTNVHPKKRTYVLSGPTGELNSHVG